VAFSLTFLPDPIVLSSLKSSSRDNGSQQVEMSEGIAMRLKTLAAIFLWSPLLASAGINSWTGIGPAGASVTTIVFGKTAGTVFAAGASGVYRSLNDGADWQAIKTDFPGNPPTGMAIDPSDATRLYVVAPTWPSLYVSTDSGATLQPAVGLPTAVTQAGEVGVSHDGRTLYIANAGQIFSSTDRGATWAQRTAISSDPVALPASLVVDPTDANSAYVSIQLTTAALAQVLATHDGGTTWQVLSSDASGPAPALAINPTNPAQLWSARSDGLSTSLDRGLHWTSLLPGIPMVAVSLDPQNPASVYAVTVYGVVYRSADNGAHWTSVTGSISAGQPTCIAVDPVQSVRVLVGGYAGVAGSSDSGSSWSAQEGGMLASTVIGLSADPTTDRIFANVNDQGLYAATTGGSGFLPINNDGLYTLEYGSPNPPHTTNFISAILARPGGLLASMTAGLAISQDGGNTWTLSQVVPPASGSQQLFYIAGFTSAPQTLLAAAYSSTYRSVDGGNLWTASSGLPANSGSGDLLTAPSDGHVAYSLVYTIGTGTILGIYRTSDAGISWTAGTSMPAGLRLLLAVDPTSAATLYGSTDTALFKSTDSGGTWSALPANTVFNGGPVQLAVDPLHPQILIAARGGGIARSVDGGTTWETVRADSLPGWSTSSLLLDPLRPESLLVATSHSGVQQITIAPNLSVTGVAPGSPVAIGAPLTFGLTIANLGPFAATDVALNVPLPAMTQSATASAPGATCTTGAASASCQFPILRSGASAAVTVTANGVPAGPVQVIASVAADQPNSNTQHGSITLMTAVAAVADLSVSATGNAAAQTADPLMYTITVSNAGPNTAAALNLIFQLAAGLTPGTITTATGSCSISTAALVSCALGDLAAGGSVTMSVAATAAATGSQVSRVQVGSAAADPASANNAATVSTSVTGPSAAMVTVVAKSGGGGGLSLGDLLLLGLIAGYVRWAQIRRLEAVV
jgi:uncharacterized repeat protein (TIGR01451 family)